MKPTQTDAQIRRGARQLRQIGDFRVAKGSHTRPRGRLLISGAGLAACLVLAGFALMPRHASADAIFRHVRSAVAKAMGYHLTEYRFDAQGTAVPFKEWWVKHDQIRIETSDRVDVGDDHREYIYRKDLGKAATFVVDSSYRRFISDSLLMSDLLAKVQSNGTAVVDTDDEAFLGNTAAAQVTIENNSPEWREVIYFDKSTYLPIRMDSFARDGWGWKQTGYTVPDFSTPLDDSVFEPKIPAEVSIVDTDRAPKAEAANLIHQLCDRE